MTFIFRAYEPTKFIGQPEEIVSACEWARSKLLPDRHLQDKQDIIFEIVDVRPGPHHEASVFALNEALLKLLLGDNTMLTTLTARSQLLFVGATPSLSSYPPEAGTAAEPKKRDIRRDVEFSIRVLRSYGIALYGCIDGDLLLRNSPDDLPFVTSALRLFERFYREKTTLERRGEVPAPAIRAPSELDTIDQIGTLRTHFRELRDSAQRSGEFSRIGKHDRPDMQQFEELDLLREIGLLFELGRGERQSGMSPRDRLEALDALSPSRLTFSERGTAHSSYKLFVESLAKVAEWVPLYGLDRRPGNEQQDANPAGGATSGTIIDIARRQLLEQELTLDLYKLERFNLLRDFGRVLGQGSLTKLRALDDGKPHILIIDDWLYDTLQENEPEDSSHILINRLNGAFDAAWQGGAKVFVVASSAIEANEPFSASHFGRIFDHKAPAFQLSGASRPQIGHPELRSKLEDYSLILIDPEATHDSLGAARVQRIAKYLEQVGSSPVLRAGEAPAKRLRTPPLIAFSQKESSGYVQQCLNMGARAFVAKHRPYHLLFDLSRVLSDPDALRDDTQDASQFRLLRVLKPNAVAKLKRAVAPFYVHGGIERDDGTVEQHRLEHNWVQSLPKADLHCHIGTAIDLNTVTLLALNTAGYFLDSARKSTNHGSLHPNAAELLDRIATTVRLAAYLRNEHSDTPLIELLAAASHGIRSEQDLKWKSFGLGDAIIKQLSDPNERCDHAHMTALLVAAIQAEAEELELSRDGALSSPPVALKRRHDAVKRFFMTLESVMNSNEAHPEWSGAFEARAALAREAVRAHRHFLRLGFRWAGETSHESVDHLLTKPKAEFWSALERQMTDRIMTAAHEIRSARHRALSSPAWETGLKRAEAWIKANRGKLGKLTRPQTGAPTLEAYVTVAREHGRRSLQLYLRGADLLGSAHLQYPENLLVAAHAITHENAVDNVIYSELRCETTGYSKAGMGAHDATEILRHGFNLASLYWAGVPIDARADGVQRGEAATAARRCFPLVRTNILLAAKRHKDEADARAIVELLDHYLERRPSNADRGWSRSDYHQTFGASIPTWWRPCDVVGFDISGNEASEAPWLEGLIKQLSSRSSPITIHAGEAADAQSIWNAVHKFNAIRIGHGLRLGENLALLGHCVRENICMEMCPNSNYLTNAFEAPTRIEDETALKLYEGKYAYPLLSYMRAGMEVTIGTDNRHLHAPDGRSLTSEYLMAARLVGGLTRWEVLQIVKAGFKNAFLDKSEVRKLLGAAEEGIYRIISGDGA